MELFLSRWTFDLFLAVNLLAACGWYLWAARRAARRDRWHAGQTVCFLTGIGLIAIIYLGPIAAWSHTFFWAHMTQHLVVMMAAAPLLVLGSPMTLIFKASSDATRRRWFAPIMRSRSVRILTNSVVTWLLFAAVLLGVHFTAFYNWALVNHDVDAFLEQPVYLIAAFLFYFPLIGSNLQPRRPTHATRMISLALMMIPEAITGAVIYFSPVLLYPAFAVPRPFGLDPIGDQQLSGALMWALVMVVDAGWLMLAATEWFTSEERRGQRIDRASAAAAMEAAS
ncbi:MAG: cytochrome c oxidase assembly protein [Actinomycetota bacterium]|nr:cytochrome c oxidase assembly protein [Actinomycetota bacterium]